MGAVMAKAVSINRNARDFISVVRRCRLCMMWFVLGILRVKWRMSCEVESPWTLKFQVLAKRMEQYLSAEIE
jgi:hypothetical protein